MYTTVIIIHVHSAVYMYMYTQCTCTCSYVALEFSPQLNEARLVKCYCRVRGGQGLGSFLYLPYWKYIAN